MKKFFLATFFLVELWGSDLNSLIKQAKSGDKVAIYQLGYIYENGLGVKKDLQKAKAFYEKAAKLGSMDALVSLELLQIDKVSTKHNFKNISNKIYIKNGEQLHYVFNYKDIKEIVQKAKQNDNEALFTLAVMIENGIVKTQKKKALLLYKKAAKLGNKKAQKILSIEEGATRK